MLSAALWLADKPYDVGFGITVTRDSLEYLWAMAEHLNKKPE